MSLMTMDRFVLAMRRTPRILALVVQGLSDDRAREVTDGPDGWSIAEIVGHLVDYEDIFLERFELVASETRPSLRSYDQNELVRERGYASQDLSALLATFLAKRERTIAYLEGLDEAAWTRTGLHGAWGEVDMLQLAMNIPLHDINHIEQIGRALGVMH